MSEADTLGQLKPELLRQAKEQGFSDFQVARAVYGDKATRASMAEVRSCARISASPLW